MACHNFCQLNDNRAKFFIYGILNKRDMYLFAIRYFVVRTSYKIFETLEGTFEPKELFLRPFKSQFKHRYYDKDYTVRLINPNWDEKFIAGYLLKQRPAHLIIPTDEYIEDQEFQNNYDTLFFTIDQEEQLFICELNAAVAKPENVKNLLYEVCEFYNMNEGYEVKLDFIVDNKRFWQIIKDAQGIYKIGFNLTAPNLFGSSKKANEWLTELRNVNNMTSIDFELNNTNAELHYNNEELESYRDYADSGGGSWRLKILTPTGRKRNYKSQNNIKKREVTLNSTSPVYVKNNIGNVISVIADFISSIGGKVGED